MIGRIGLRPYDPLDRLLDPRISLGYSRANSNVRSIHSTAAQDNPPRYEEVVRSCRINFPTATETTQTNRQRDPVVTLAASTTPATSASRVVNRRDSNVCSSCRALAKSRDKTIRTLVLLYIGTLLFFILVIAAETYFNCTGTESL